MDPRPLPLLGLRLFLLQQDLPSLRRSNNAAMSSFPSRSRTRTKTAPRDPICAAYGCALLPRFRLNWYRRTGAIFLRLSPVACGESAGSPTSVPERFLPLVPSVLVAVSSRRLPRECLACANEFFFCLIVLAFSLCTFYPVPSAVRAVAARCKLPFTPAQAFPERI